MKLHVLPCVFAALCLALALGAREAPAQTASATSSSFSSSANETTATEPEAPGPAPALGLERGHTLEAPEPSTRAFRSVAFEAKLGVNGIGFDIATPLNRFLHLRGGAQFFDQTVSISSDGILTNGDITLQNVHASVDIFPFRHSSFHLSPGITLHNDNHIAGPINIPAGQSFSLGDTDYTSDPTNPITGFSRLRFGSNIGPRFTVGFGNMLPRGGSRFSVPVEVGFQYTSAPTLELVLQGSGCDASGCGPITSSDGTDNLQSEIQMIEADIRPLRFFPIASVGVSYKFGR